MRTPRQWLQRKNNHYIPWVDVIAQVQQECADYYVAKVAALESRLAQAEDPDAETCESCGLDCAPEQIAWEVEDAWICKACAAALRAEGEA